MMIFAKFTNPWGQGDSGKNSEKLDDLIKKSQDKFAHLVSQVGKGGQGGNNDGGSPAAWRMFGTIGFILLTLWLLTGLYTLQPDEEGVVLRFGRYNRTASPGLNYRLPEPIESLTKISVTRINREEIGFRSRSGGVSRSYDKDDGEGQNVPQESLMLTGDENIIDIDFDVQWKINDAMKFLFNVRDLPGENTVKTAAESAMREVIGKSRITDALAEERYNIEQEAKKLLQDILNSYNMGVEIVRLQMLRVEPPKDVIDAYRDVQSARADREREINRAYAYRNDVVPRASGEAAGIVQAAEGYKNQIVAQARGDASRFIAVYGQYRNARDTTRKRMYLDTMENTMKGMSKIIIDNKNGTVPIVGIPELLAKRKQVAGGGAEQASATDTNGTTNASGANDR